MVEFAFLFLGVAISPAIFLVGFLTGLGVARIQGAVERERFRQETMAEARRRAWHSVGGPLTN